MRWGRGLAKKRDLFLTAAPAALLLAGAFAVAVQFVRPAPPKRLVLATGLDEGGSKYYAKRYQELLARSAVRVDLRATSGSAENVRELADPESDVDAAFVLGGTDGAEGVVSLGALAYAPIWLFYSGERLGDLGGLRGKRVSVGPPESATRALAVKLLAANGVTDANATLVEADRKEAMERLTSGSIDALFTISPAEAPAIARFAATPGVHIHSFGRADAYVRRFPFLTKLVLPRGVLDLGADVPDADTLLLAPTANLLARDEIHPALAYLLLRAATEIHASPGLLAAPGEFPSARENGFATSEDAKRYYRSGVPFVQRYLPFWAANLVDRLWVMIVPIIVVLIPLMRVMPPVYRWRVRSRIYRWYARLKELETRLEDDPPREVLEEMLGQLDDAERAVNRIPMPASHAESLYSFRAHLELVRQRLRAQLAKSA